MSTIIYKKIIQNKRAYYDYLIEKKIESGIILFGWEVKSIRSNMITINNSYVTLHNKEAYLYNSSFQTNIIQSNENNYNPIRIRKLLLNKYELLFLKEKTHQFGYTIIVLELYWKNNWIKVNIGVAKGKKKYDKRYEMKKNMWKREKVKILNTYK